MKTLTLLAPFLAALLLGSCSNPAGDAAADAAVDAATADMGIVEGTAVRKATGHGTDPVEKAKQDSVDKINSLAN